MSYNPIKIEPTIADDGALTQALVKSRLGDIRWQFRGDWRQKLLQGDDLREVDWFALERDSRATPVKTGYLRAVWRVELGSDIVYAKVVAAKRNTFAVRIRYALGKTASHREWRACLAAMRRGAPVVRPVAFAMRGGTSPATVLITEAFNGASELSTVWMDAVKQSDRHAQRNDIEQLTRAVATLYADAHRTGFVHLDGHPGNILIARTDGGLRARFADTTDTRLFNGQPPWIQIVNALAHLDHYMKRLATRAERFRFLKHYLDCLRGPKPPANEIWTTRRVVPAIIAQESVHAAALARQRDRRISRPGKYFTRIDLGAGWHATVVLDLERRHVFPERWTPDFTESRWRELLAGLNQRQESVEAVRTRLAGANLCQQTAFAGGFLTAWCWRVFGSPAWRRFFRCHALRHRDLPAPLVLAYVEHRSVSNAADRAMLIYPADQKHRTKG